MAKQTSDEHIEELYEQYMAEVYDILMDSYEAIGDKVHDLVEDIVATATDEGDNDE